jgi:Cu+-exporting ATPase
MNSKLLVFFHGSVGVSEDVSMSLEVPGAVSSQVLHNGEVREYSFISTEAEFTRSLETSLERQGLAECCSISSLLTPQNSACVIAVDGMTCNSCVKLIESTTSQVTGVSSIKVSLQFKKAFVQYNPDVVKPAELGVAIYDMGFDAEVLSVHEAGAQLDDTRSSPEVLPEIKSGGGASRTTPQATHPSVIIDIEGMTCSSCVQNIESNLSEVKGVRSTEVSLQDKNARITFDQTLTTPQELATAIERTGFVAKLKDDVTSSVGSDWKAGRLRVCHVGIDGMTCHSCVSLIESVLGDLEGVVNVNVSLACKEGSVEFNEAATSPDVISKAVDQMGFLVTYITGKSGKGRMRREG